MAGKSQNFQKNLSIQIRILTESGWLGICFGKVLLIINCCVAVILAVEFFILDEWCNVLLWCPLLVFGAVPGPILVLLPLPAGRGSCCLGINKVLGLSGESEVDRMDWARRTTPGLAGWCRISLRVLTASATLKERSGIILGWLGWSSRRKSGGGGSAARSTSSEGAGGGGAGWMDDRWLGGPSANGVISN